MRRILYIVLMCSFVLSQFGIREEIISRHDNGNKKMVVKYQGSGSNERIVERITYDESDNVLLIEMPSENKKIEFTYDDYNGEVVMLGKIHYHKDEVVKEIEYEYGDFYKAEFEVFDDYMLVINVWNLDGVKVLSNGNGSFVLYDNQNRIWVEAAAVNGKPHGTTKRYREGIIHKKFDMRHGEKHGEDIEYYSNGQIEKICNYVEDEIVGECNYYNEDGTRIKNDDVQNYGDITVGPEPVSNNYCVGMKGGMDCRDLQFLYDLKTMNKNIVCSLEGCDCSNYEYDYFYSNKIWSRDGRVYWIDIDEHNLDILPPSISNVDNLENFYFSANNIKSIPSKIGKLNNLEVIFFYSNQIKHIPYINLSSGDGESNISFRNNPIYSISSDFCEDVEKGVIAPTDSGDNFEFINRYCK